MFVWQFDCQQGGLGEASCDERPGGGIDDFLGDSLANADDIGSAFIRAVSLWSEESYGIFAPRNSASYAPGSVLAARHLPYEDVGGAIYEP